MAVTIPQVTGPSVRTNAMPVPQVMTQQADNSMLELGTAVLNTAANIYQQSRKEAENSALIEAESKLSQWKTNAMFNEENGVYTRKGSNALNVTNEMLEQYDNQVNELSASMSDKRLANRFRQLAMSQRSSLSSELNRYEFGERQNYYDQVDKTSLETSADAAVRYYRDPQQVAFYQNKGAAVIMEQGRRKGLPPETVQELMGKYNSGISAQVIQRMADEDPMKAQQYYAGAMGYMTADDQIKVSKTLAAGVAKQQANAFVEGIWYGGAADNNSLPMLMVEVESSGQVDAVSPKGALGLMQLMPETAKEVAAELGVPYDEERLTTDANYNMALGTHYLNKLRGKYSDNTVLALAAYNGGQGNVDKWLKEIGDPRTGEISTAEFAARIPFKDTREYVQKITSKMANTSAPIDSARRQADAYRAVMAIQDPRQRDLATQRLTELIKADKLEADARYESLAKVVIDRGINGLSAEALSSLPADDYQKLIKLDKSIHGTEKIVTDYDKLQEFIDMPANQLAELSLARDIRPYLSNTDFTRVLGAYEKAKQGDSSGITGLAIEEKVLNEYMGMAGILTGNSKEAMTAGNIKAREQYGAAYFDAKTAFIKKNDREPTANEIREILRDQTLNVRLAGTGWFSDDMVPRWKVDAMQTDAAYVDPSDLSVSDIPPQERARITQAIRESGGTPSEDFVIRMYLEGLSQRGVKVK